MPSIRLAVVLGMAMTGTLLWLTGAWLWPDHRDASMWLLGAAVILVIGALIVSVPYFRRPPD